jgi:hypothetical protein
LDIESKDSRVDNAGIKFTCDISSVSGPCSPIQRYTYAYDKEPSMNNQIGSLFSTRLSTAYNQLRGDLGVPQTATDTIDKLVEKIQTSAAVEDRRTAVLGLKGLSRDWKEVSFDHSFLGHKLIHVGCRKERDVSAGRGSTARCAFRRRYCQGDARDPNAALRGPGEGKSHSRIS